MKMKNMKRTIIGIAVLAIVLIIMMGSVNAASLTTSSDKVSKGENVTITVNMEPSRATEVNLKYDANIFEYVSSSASMVTDENGSLIATYLTPYGTTTISQMTFTFKAKENSEGANFEVTAFTTDAKGDTVNNTVTVAVADPEPSVDPEQPTDPELVEQIKEELKLTFYDYDLIPEDEIEAVIQDRLASGELDNKDLTMKTFEVKKILQGLK